MHRGVGYGISVRGKSVFKMNSSSDSSLATLSVDGETSGAGVVGAISLSSKGPCWAMNVGSLARHDNKGEPAVRLGYFSVSFGSSFLLTGDVVSSLSMSEDQQVLIACTSSTFFSIAWNSSNAKIGMYYRGMSVGSRAVPGWP